MKPRVVGILAAKEEPLVHDLIEYINHNNDRGITAELCRIPEMNLEMKIPYSVIIDRISHVMPYYLQFAKEAMLQGCCVINNPFRFYVEKFFGFAAAREIGVPVPKTILLPPKYPGRNLDSDDLQNLAFPLDWKAITDFIGFPAYFKPAGGWGWRDVNRVTTFEELMEHYNESGKELMLLQEEICYNHYVRCFCFGRKYTMPIHYKPEAPFHEQYVVDHEHLTPEQGEKIHRYACALSDVLDFDMNVCEFAICNDEPIAIDFTNMVPDMNPDSIRWHYYGWAVEHLGKTAIEYVDNPPAPGAWKSAEAMFLRNQRISRGMNP